jgi:hypothetical protein
MTIHIEYLQANRKWVLTINGKWIVSADSFDIIAAALLDRFPALGRVAKAS